MCSSDLPVGRYTVTSEEAGFSTTVTPEFALTVNAQQRVDLSMAVGGAATTVEVSAAPTLLETEIKTPRFNFGSRGSTAGCSGCCATRRSEISANPVRRPPVGD